MEADADADVGQSGASGWIESALSMVFPGVCGVCGLKRAGAADGYVCRDCSEAPGHVRWIRPPWCGRCGLPFDGDIHGEFTCANCEGLDLGFDWARASVIATPFVLDLVHRFKYGGRRWHAAYLESLLVRQAASALAGGGWDGLVPVPLHPLREREREFNQAEVLATGLSRATGLALRRRWVIRVAATRVQASLDRRERSKNVRGAFRVPEPGRVGGGRFVVVDDVLTTGATTSAVAGALKEAGAREVVVWTLARGA